MYTAHALERIGQRYPNGTDFIEKAIRYGDIIEEYETDEEARYLIHWSLSLGEHMVLHLHVVAADQSIGRTVVITAYDPSNQPERWSDDYKQRIE